jgi:hypothetical protein
MFGADLFILSAILAYKGGTIDPTGPCTGQEARGGGSIQSIDWGAYILSLPKMDKVNFKVSLHLNKS